MNFLAHLFLSGEDTELLLGNFMGDFVNNRQVLDLPEGMRRGVRLHREIDSFTDRHLQVLQGKKRLYARHGKYAPVLIDIFYDYFLANNWEQYSLEPFGKYVARIYSLLSEHQAAFPSRLQKLLPNMIADDWLSAYAHYGGLETTFYYLRRRVSRPDLLDGAVERLRISEDQFDLEFNAFFPDLQAHVKSMKGSL
jgi:acyl carrier protein phosphodiesterase